MKKNAVILLVLLTYLYLALPYYIFFLGWFKIQIGLALALLLSLSVGWVVVDLARNGGLGDFAHQWRARQSKWDWAALLLGSVVVIYTSGVAGFGVQSGDWIKHNMILTNLVSYPSPPYYDLYGKPVALVYFIGYYLPAAMIGKLFGIYWGNQALALWTLAGFMLAVVWLSVLSQRRLSWAYVVLSLFSGLSMVGYFTMQFLHPYLIQRPERVFATWLDIQTYDWIRNLQYSPHIVQISWVPQHAVAAWLATSLLLFTALRQRARSGVFLVWSLTALGSVFTTIGMLPFIIAGLLPRDRMTFVDRLRSHFTWANGAGILIMAIMMLFYATKLEPLSILFNAQTRSGTILDELHNWTGPLQMLIGYLYFCLLEFGIFLAIDRFHSFRSEPSMRWTYIAVLIFLSALPLFVYGSHNDLVMRASIPGLFFVALIVARNGPIMQDTSRIRQVAWTAVLIVAIAAPILMIGQKSWLNLHQRFLNFDELAETTPINEQFIDRMDLLEQYASRVNTPFFAWLARDVPLDTPDDEDFFMFGDSILLMESRLDRTSAEAGDHVALALQLRAAKELSVNYVLALRLIDSGQNTIYEWQGWPEGTPTTSWASLRSIHYAQHPIHLPAETQPGVYLLEMYLTDPATWDKLQVYSVSTGAPQGDILPLAAITVGTPTIDEAATINQDLTLGDELALRGVQISQAEHAESGAIATVSLAWQTVKRPSTNYAVSLQVFDSDNRLVAQQDHAIAHGFLPAGLWPVGTILPDEYVLQLPEGAEKTALQFVVVVYDPDTGARLLTSSNGQPQGDSLVLNNLIELER